MSKNDNKPFRQLTTYDMKKGNELFNIIKTLDTHELVRFASKEQIPLDHTNELSGDTLIHEVINIDHRKVSQHAKLNVIKFLVQNGVSPDKPNKNNHTPLHLACQYMLDEIVLYLLEAGVNPNYIDNMGETPFHHLLKGYNKLIEKSDEILDFIQETPQKNSMMINNIKDIKIKLWEVLRTQDTFPMFTTLNKTLDELLDKDIFRNKQDELYNNISKTIMKGDDMVTNYMNKVLEGANMIRTELKKLISYESKLDNFTIIEPNTNDNSEPIHLGKSPAFPHAKSIKIFPLFDTALINDFFTYKL